MDDVLLLALFFVVAVLYSSVGHAGASGYLAVMTLVAHLTEGTARPTAFVLNILVASIGTAQFARAEHIRWKLVLPFAVGSVPMAFLAARYKPADASYNILVGIVLVCAAVRLALGTPAALAVIRSPRVWIAVPVGGAIGTLAGLTGTGGGIFITPLLLFMGWANPKTAAGVSVAFILANSISGLAGKLIDGSDITPKSAAWLVAAGVGGLIGSWFGANRSGLTTLRRLLAVVLLVAGVMLLAGR